MPTSMSFDEYVTVVERHTAALQGDAASCSMADPVPTCPGWTVADLLKHHGGVCRWAAKIVGEGRTANLSDAELGAELAAPANRDELLAWYSAGAAALVETLRTSVDGPALVFLRDAPPPRLFWARRCAHESTIHRVDAMSASLGHIPTTTAAAISMELAIDGIDELLRGFVPRRSSTLRADEPIIVSVAPTDADLAWTVTIGTGTPVTSSETTPEPDAVLTGSAADLYLGLWNRGDEIAELGRAPVLGLWREKMRVSWA
jgi:uncharacterized protein (TIGR03083 family)